MARASYLNPSKVKELNDRLNSEFDPIRNGPVYSAQWKFRAEHGGTIAEARQAWFVKTGKPWLTPKQIRDGEVIKDIDGSVALNDSQKLWALEMGMLNQDDVDPEASIGSGSGLITGRTRKENPNDLTKNELIVLGYSEGGLCKVHLGQVNGFYTVKGGKPFKIRPEQLHIPSKAALADAGQIVNKDHIYFGCHICNKVMGDGLGLMTVDEVRPIILADLKARGIRFYSFNEVEAKTEKVVIERTSYSLKAA